MMSRNYVTALVQQQRPDLSVEQISRLIDDAVRMLGRLIHYGNGGAHEDDDVVTAVLVIGQDKQE
jgi:hypothetical protein